MLKAKEHRHCPCSLSFSVIRGNLGPVQLKVSQFYPNTIENFGNVAQANRGTYTPLTWIFIVFYMGHLVKFCVN